MSRMSLDVRVRKILSIVDLTNGNLFKDVGWCIISKGTERYKGNYGLSYR